MGDPPPRRRRGQPWAPRPQAKERDNTDSERVPRRFGSNKGYLGNTAAGRGWLFRAARIIDGEVPELRGELPGATAYVTDDPVMSEALARHVAEIGCANGNSDLELMAMHAVGQAPDAAGPARGRHVAAR